MLKRDDVLADITASIAYNDAKLAEMTLPQPRQMQKPTLSAMQQKNFIQQQQPPVGMMGGRQQGSSPLTSSATPTPTPPRGATPMPPPPPSGGMPPPPPPAAGMPPTAFNTSGYAPPASQPATAPFQSAEALELLSRQHPTRPDGVNRHSANSALGKRALKAEQKYQDAKQLAEHNANIEGAKQLYQHFRNKGDSHQQAQDRAEMYMADPKFGTELRKAILTEHEAVRAEGADSLETQRQEAVAASLVTDTARDRKAGYLEMFPEGSKYAMPEKVARGLADNEDLGFDAGAKLWMDQEKARADDDGAIARENAKLRDTMYKADQTINTVEKALADVSGWTTGFGSVFAFLPATPATDLKEAIQTLNAVQGFKELFDMRQASATGGALGNVSNKEIELLYRAWTSLQTKQSEGRMRTNLNEVLERFQRVKILTQAESEGRLLGMSPYQQEQLANDGISRLKHEGFAIDNPTTFQRAMDGVRDGTITEKEFEEMHGFIPIPDNLKP